MRSDLRRPLALATSMTLLAGLAVVTTAAPASAQPSCDGRLATITDNDGTDGDPAVGSIVGTGGPDVIVGTDGDDVIDGLGGRDRICGGLGEDTIDGGAGNDRLFGGSQDDDLFGSGGHDDLFGFAGDDFILGGPGQDFATGGGGADTIKGNGQNDILQGDGGTDWIRGGTGFDRIDGGPADDDCAQGPRIRRCERADLAVKVFCPTEGGEGVISCRVRVRNLGPDATTYTLRVGEATESGAANCVALFSEDPRPFAALAPRRSRTRTYRIECSPNPDSSEKVDAEVKADAYDRRKGNNAAADVIDLP